MNQYYVENNSWFWFSEYILFVILVTKLTSYNKENCFWFILVFLSLKNQICVFKITVVLMGRNYYRKFFLLFFKWHLDTSISLSSLTKVFPLAYHFIDHKIFIFLISVFITGNCLGINKSRPCADLFLFQTDY